MNSGGPGYRYIQWFYPVGAAGASCVNNQTYYEPVAQYYQSGQTIGLGGVSYSVKMYYKSTSTTWTYYATATHSNL